MRRAAVAVAVVALAVLALRTTGRAEPAAPAAPVAIEGATIWVSPTERLDGATIVLDGGKVAAVGVGVAVPAGARRIDGRGAIVTAGLVDGLSRVGLTELAGVPETVDGSFESGVHAAYRAADGFDPRSPLVPLARTGGLTSVVAAPVGGVVAGQAAWMSLADGVADELAIAPSVALVAGPDAARGEGLERLRELLDAAGGKAAAAAIDPDASRLDLDALAAVRRGAPLIVPAHRASEIAAAIRLGRELGIRVVIDGGAEAWRVADRLAAARVPVILTPGDELPTGFDRRGARPDSARLLREAGVELVFTTTFTQPARTLRQECGLAVRAGLPWPDALAAVTTAPARVFGVARGTLERGAVADLVVWSGDPFELSSRALHVFVAGREQPLETHQSALLRRYRTSADRATR